MLELQHEVTTGADAKHLAGLGEFSLVCGGPLYQLWRRSGQAGWVACGYWSNGGGRSRHSRTRSSSDRARATTVR